VGLAGHGAGHYGPALGPRDNASGDREAPARDRDGPYSAECVEGVFCEVRIAPALAPKIWGAS
jgi:hypothetical protein